MTHRFPLVRFAAVVMIVAMPFAAFAANPVGEARGGGPSIDFASTLTGHQSVRLVMVDPNGDVVVDKTFPNGRALQVRVSDLGTAPVDGAYSYELTVTPVVNAGLAKKLAAARAANDEAAARKIMRENGLESIAQSGTFTLANGSFLDPQAQEASANLDGGVASLRDNGVGGNVPRTNPANAGTSGGGKVTVNDQVIPDDLIVQGSGCFGFDCVNNESFGFDTIRMKENNLRIKAEDTSTGTFPTNDWQLTFNDSASGGASKFSVEDITGAKVPMTITGGAATNSIFVDSTGRVGFRTSTPVLDLHVSTSNTPALRLEQTNAGGFTAQTWDVAGNEANFFVRDVTSGSRLPFRIRPGAPTSSIDISADGDVGIGTASPQAGLHVVTNLRIDGTDAPGGFRAIGFGGNSATLNPNIYSNGSYLVLNAKNGANSLHLNFDSGATSITTLQASGGTVGIGTTSPQSRFHVSGGDIRVSGGSFIDDGTTLNVPDYVFDESYKLMPLTELKKFIAENNHLPNVPSAANVKAAGLNLSQMQMRLLEKVEELTLYTLDQHDVIAELKAQNEALQNRLKAIDEKLAQQQ